MCPHRAPGRLAAGLLGRQAGIVLGREQVLGDRVDGTADVLDRLRQPLAAGAQLFDLGVEHLAAFGQVGEHPGSETLRFVDHGPALLAGVGQQVVRLVTGLLDSAAACWSVRSRSSLGRCSALARCSVNRVSVCVRVCSISFCASARSRVASAVCLGHDLFRRFVCAVKDPGRLRTQSCGQRSIVEDGVGRPVLGVGHLLDELVSRSAMA